MQNSKKTVLLLSDSVKKTHLIREHLTLEKNQFETAASVIGVIDCLKKRPVDCLILTDLNNQLDGLQCLQQIKSHRAITLPAVIYLSHLADEDRRLSALSQGISEFIHEPNLSPELLSHCIDSGVLRHRLQKETNHTHFHNQPIDPLTHLPNRTGFFQLLDKYIASANRYNRLSSLLLIQIDNLNQINSQIDYDAGDELLQQVTERLKESLRRDDVIARVNGNEFALILNQINHEYDANIVAEKLSYMLQQTFCIGNHQVKTYFNIGVVCFNDDTHDKEQLLQHATKAMYYAKSKKLTTYAFYRDSIHANQKNNQLLGKELSNCIKRQELFLLYQPICHLSTQVIVGFESLLRWHNHNLNRVIYPAEFLPIAKKSGFINTLEHWGIANSLKQLKIWQDKFCFNGTVSINLSPQHLYRDEFMDNVLKLLHQYQITPDKVHFELTESELTNNDFKLSEAITRAGLHLQIDNFGTGYSSLSQLKMLNVGALKIDKKYINNIGNPKTDSMIKSMIAMADSLGLSVIAEGVESKSQQQFLTAVGCQYGQGYFYSKPITQHSASELLKKYAA